MGVAGDELGRGPCRRSDPGILERLPEEESSMPFLQVFQTRASRSMRRPFWSLKKPHFEKGTINESGASSSSCVFLSPEG